MWTLSHPALSSLLCCSYHKQLSWVLLLPLMTQLHACWRVQPVLRAFATTLKAAVCSLGTSDLQAGQVYSKMRLCAGKPGMSLTAWAAIEGSDRHDTCDGTGLPYIQVMAKE